MNSKRCFIIFLVVFCLSLICLMLFSIIGLDAYYFFYITLFVFVFFILNYAFKTTNYYKNKYIDCYKFLGKTPSSINVINLGSNQAKFAIDYVYVDVKGMNWAMGPQNFYYDFEILKKYKCKLAENANVIVTICPFSFFFYRTDDEFNYKYYLLLNSDVIDGYSILKHVSKVTLPILSSGKSILRIIKDVPCDNRLKYESNKLSEEELRADALRWVEGWKKQFKISSLNCFKPSNCCEDSIKNNLKILKSISSYCNEFGFKVTYVILPTTKYLQEMIPDDFFKQYVLDTTKQVAEEHEQVISYWMDDGLQCEKLYFNSFFMNERGRKKLTKRIIEDIEP